MGKAWKHFKTITYHKYLVAKGCFAVGLYKQGLLHDLSKYSPWEFFIGVKYYQGNRSPNNAEREQQGFSSAWLHHKGRNKHHYEYWTDYNEEQGGTAAVPMPDRYIAEMVMDRIAASKVYEGKNYTDASPLKYYRAGKERAHSAEGGPAKENAQMHPYTRTMLEKLLKMLAEKGEQRTFAYIRRRFLK